MTSSGAAREMTNNPGYYKNLVAFSKNLPTPHGYQIELDLKRTFPEEPRCMTDSFVNSLRNILIAYSVRNSSIGYCQGMNFIAGKLLLVLEDEEKAFWLFVQIIEYLLPINYFSELAGVITNTTMMALLIEKYLPDLYSFFQKNQFELTVNNFIHKWLVCLFAQNFNLNLSDIILDFFFLEGYIIIIKTCLGVFAILRKQLMAHNDFEEVYQVLNEKTNDIKNPLLFLYFIARRKFEFNIRKINYFQDILQIPIIENLRREKVKRGLANLNYQPIIKKTKKKPQCDPNWPFCLKENINSDILQVLVLNFHRTPYIIDDYYYTKTFSYPSEKEALIDEYFASGNSDLLLERQKHRCDDRKLVESSIIMLDGKKAHSSNDVRPQVNTERVSLYEIAKKGEGFEKAKGKIMNELIASPIYENEIKEYL